MQLTKAIAEQCLKEAGIKNPGPWTDHSRYVAQACQIIASHCDNLNEDDAYCYGLLHDIGRYVGVTKERHMLDGYTYCKERGWDKAAQIALDHAFMLHDIKTSISDFDMTDAEYNEYLTTRKADIRKMLFEHLKTTRTNKYISQYDISILYFLSDKYHQKHKNKL